MMSTIYYTYTIYILCDFHGSNTGLLDGHYQLPCPVYFTERRNISRRNISHLFCNFNLYGADKIRRIVSDENFVFSGFSSPNSD